MGMTPEGKIKKKIDKLLKKYGVWYFKPQAGAFGKSGIPDYICCFYGQFIAIEAKADYTKKPTALQLKCMEDIEGAWGRAYVVFDDDTLDHVELVLKMYEGGNS
jgi:hypothetical protein